jgi:acetyl esterase
VAEHADEVGVDPQRIAVGGDSAGGNLAAVVAIDARDHGGPRLKHQFLVYPATDMRMDWPSAERHAKQLPLTKAAMDWFIAHYLRNDADKADWRASPLRASNLKGLPPALIITAGFDPLCDEGEAYAKALRTAGVSVTHELFGGQIHGFLTMGRIVADSGRAIAMGAAALRQSFAAS